MTDPQAKSFPARRWQIFSVVAVGVFLSTMDSSMVNIALPFIMQSFHSQLHRVEWVVMAYLLTITATLLIWGYLADRIGRKRVYAAGLLVFAIGAMACSQASRLDWLIAARFLQAMGAACMMATGPAIIRQTFPPEKLGRALGMIGIAVSFGLMTGPVAGGMLIDLYSWRATFFISVPVALVAFLLCCIIIPSVTARAGAEAPRLDWPGGVSWTVALVLLALAVTRLGTGPWPTAGPGLLGLGGLFFLIFFVYLERRSPHSLLPMPLFRESFYWKAVLCAALSFFVLFSVLLLLPFYLGRLRELSASMIGLTMLAIPVTALGVAPIAGSLSDLIGHRFLTAFGLLLSSLGTLGLCLLDAHTRLLKVGLILALVGGGQAMFLSPNSSSLLGRIPLRFTAASAALLATARNLGMLLGIAVTGLIFSLSYRHLTGGLDLRDYDSSHQGAFLTAMRHSFVIAAGVGLVAVLLAWSRKQVKSSPEL